MSETAGKIIASKKQKLWRNKKGGLSLFQVSYSKLIPSVFTLFTGMLILIVSPVVTTEASAADCTGSSLQISNRTYNFGDTEHCIGTDTIQFGSSVIVESGAEVSLISPKTTITAPVTIAKGARFSAKAMGADISPPNQVQLSVFTGSKIHAYRLTDLKIPIEEPVIASSITNGIERADQFYLSLSGIPDDEWILVTATGGQELDTDGNGVLDTTPTTNLGTIHALARAADWRKGGQHVNALTEMVWRYTQNLVGMVSPDELVIRMDGLAQQLIAEDLDGNGSVDWQDALNFSSTDSVHKFGLNFDYQILFALSAENYSIILAILDGDESLLGQLLDTHFGHTFTRYPVPDPRYSSIKVEVLLFGDGSISSDGAYGISVDSELPAEDNTSYFFAAKKTTETVTFTATPTSETEILSWKGCDSVSADLSQCTVSLDNNRVVVPSFGYTTTELTGEIYDLSATTNILTQDGVDVLIDADDDAMTIELAGMQVDDFIVGSTGDGFLRKVTSIIQLDDHHYQLGTMDATLEEIIAQGTGNLVRTMTNGDLLGYEAPTTVKSLSAVDKSSFDGLPGVRLIPSNDPTDPVFRLDFGEPVVGVAGASKLSVTKVVELGSGVTATGSLSLEFDLDVGVSFGLIKGLKSFRFLTQVTSTEAVSISVTGENAFAEEKSIGTLRFTKIKFTIGPVPVWITPKIELYLGANGSVDGTLTAGIELVQVTTAGVVYRKGDGFNTIGTLKPSWNPTYPELDVKASLQGYARAEPMFLLYGITGPALPTKAYLKLNVEPTEGTWSNDACDDSFKMNFIAGLVSKFQWNMSGNTKLGRFLHLDQLQERTSKILMQREWPLKSWHVDRSSCFTKLNVKGRALADNAEEWSCIKDDNTGLVWETKAMDGASFRNPSNRYSWYDPNPATNGGWEGCDHPSDVTWKQPSSEGVEACTSRLPGDFCSLDNCNTNEYAKAVNSSQLCGGTHWRLPTRAELLALKEAVIEDEHNRNYYFPAIVNSPSYYLFTSDTYPSSYNGSHAWGVNFYRDYPAGPFKGQDKIVYLVR